MNFNTAVVTFRDLLLFALVRDHAMTESEAEERLKDAVINGDEEVASIVKQILDCQE